MRISDLHPAVSPVRFLNAGFCLIQGKKWAGTTNDVAEIDKILQMMLSDSVQRTVETPFLSSALSTYLTNPPVVVIPPFGPSFFLPTPKTLAMSFAMYGHVCWKGEEVKRSGRSLTAVLHLEHFSHLPCVELELVSLCRSGTINCRLQRNEEKERKKITSVIAPRSNNVVILVISVLCSEIMMLQKK